MKRVLYVATVDPFLRGGGSQATRAYLDSTLELFGESNVDVMVPDETVVPEEYKHIKYIRVKIRGQEKYLHYFIGYLSRFTKPLIEYFAHKRNKYFLCIINGGIKAGIAVEKLYKSGIKTVVIHHNNELEYHLDNKTIETLGGKFSFFIKKTQGIAYKYADLNLFLTNQDLDSFRELYGNTRGINKLLGCYEIKASKDIFFDYKGKEFSISMSGTLANYQTTSGVLDFYRRYLHITKRLIPNLKIVLTGRNPSEEIIQIQKENVDIITVIPNPTDVYEIVQRGQIYLCPTNIGGGLKLRAMDGLKCGLPILIHKVSARGYDYFYDKPYFKIYKDEKSFEDGLSKIILYLNSDNSVNILKDFDEFFGYKNGKDRMKKALLRIIDEKFFK